MALFLIFRHLLCFFVGLSAAKEKLEIVKEPKKYRLKPHFVKGFFINMISLNKIKNSLGIRGKILLTAFISSVIFYIIFISLASVVLRAVSSFSPEWPHEFLGISSGGWFLIILILCVLLFLLFALIRLKDPVWNPHGAFFIFSFAFFSILVAMVFLALTGGGGHIGEGYLLVLTVAPGVLAISPLIGKLLAWIALRSTKAVPEYQIDKFSSILIPVLILILGVLFYFYHFSPIPTYERIAPTLWGRLRGFIIWPLAIADLIAIMVILLKKGKTKF